MITYPQFYRTTLDAQLFYPFTAPQLDNTIAHENSEFSDE